MAANGLTNGANGTLSVGARLHRIEDSLIRIEDRLVEKTDEEDLKPLERRLSLLEAGEAPLSKVLLEQFHSLNASVADIRDHGSRQAQDANSRVSRLENKVEQLEDHDQQKTAIDRTLSVRVANKFRWWMLLLTGVGVALASLNIANLVAH